MNPPLFGELPEPREQRDQVHGRIASDPYKVFTGSYRRFGNGGTAESRNNCNGNGKDLGHDAHGS